MRDSRRGGRLARARSIAIDVSPLRDSVGYRALWLGQSVSLVGTNMRLVAVAFQVFALTGSSVAVGLIGAVELVPLIALSMVGGALADAFDRRKVIAVAQLFLLVGSLSLGVLTLVGEPSLTWIYVLVALHSAATAVDHPARTSLTPTLVEAAQVPAAMALRQVAFQTTYIVGPALGGLLIAAVDNVGWLYVFDALTYVGSLVALRWVPSVPVGDASDGATERGLTPAAIRAGVAYALRTPVILGIFVVDLVAMIFGMPRAVFPALAQETFAVGAAGLGLLYAAPSVGALAGALTSGWVNGVRRRGVAVLVAVAVWGIAIALAGLTVFSFTLTLVLLAVAGAADVFSAVFRSTVLVEVTPPELLGRVYALNLMVVSGGPKLGDVEAGALARLVGPAPSVFLGGLACVAGIAVVALTFRSLRAYEPPVNAIEEVRAGAAPP